MEQILSQLNPAQRQAVVHTQGPSMIIAGAGSGKTRVLTFRIAYLIEKEKVDPFSILSLTFTNKAAREMKSRIGTVVGNSEAQNIWMGTFHSVFARILRAEAAHLGYPSNFTIYDTEDSLKVIANIVKEKQLDKDIYKPKSLQRRISGLKNNLITPKMYDRFPELSEQDHAAKVPLTKEIYQSYCERCFRSGAMDFDDLLLKTNELLATFPEVLSKYQDRFRYIMVDEYQDTNHSQYIIVKALASRFENLCVVGDDAQSIYAFRGANIRNILNFKKDYPDAALFKLEQNYRSTKMIVEAANSLISKNKDQLEKDVWTQNVQGDRIHIHKTLNDNQEAFFVAEQILEKQKEAGAGLNDFAILYRTNSQSRSMEEALRKKGIDYRIFGGLSFYQRKEVKDLIAYMRLAINPKDEEALRRVINYPARGIGTTTIDRITLAAQNKNISFWEACEKIDEYGVELNKPTKKRILDFVTKIKSYANMLETQDAYSAAEYIAKNSGVLANLAEDKTPEGISRYENVQELLNSIKEFADESAEVEEDVSGLAEFLSDVALITDADKDKDKDKPQVSLMTIHLAKGLEFPYVFIVGMEEGLFPNMMMVTSRPDLEEERRLFYVALTRAEKKVTLTYCHTRYRWGKLINCEPSRFLDEIDDRYLNFDIPDITPYDSGNPKLFGEPRVNFAHTQQKPMASSKQKEEKQGAGGAYAPNRKNLRPLQKNEASTTNEDSTSTLQVDDRVIHERFGKGVVIQIEGEGNNAKASIRFEKAGEKKLLLKFARLRRLS